MSKSQYTDLLCAYEQKARPGVVSADLARTEELIVHGRSVSLSFSPEENYPEDGKVICSTDIAKFNQEPAADLCRLLLQANNLWAGTAGSTVGLRGNDMLLMSASRRIGSLDADNLDAFLSALCADADSWAARLTAKPPKENPPPEYMLHMRA
ncbi:MAG: CesT family type III secretion system chaperone [Comamonadaceae bacterium]|nr:CesT family type III secretion system chaperone [Comamonadaceae bacterium]